MCDVTEPQVVPAVALQHPHEPTAVYTAHTDHNITIIAAVALQHPRELTAVYTAYTVHNITIKAAVALQHPRELTAILTHGTHCPQYYNYRYSLHCFSLWLYV